MNLQPLLARLKVSEGWSPTAYIDTTGHVTIGYGHNLGKLVLPPGVRHQDVKLQPVNGITRTIGEVLLLDKVVETAEALRGELPWMDKLDVVRQQVLVDMAFNMGVRGTGKPGAKKGLVDGWPIFLSQVRAGLWQAAANNMLGTPWRRQVGERAVRLAYMMLHGKEQEA